MKNLIIMTLILFLIMVFFPMISLIDNSSEVEKNSQTVTQAPTDTDDAEAETVSVLISATGKTEEMSIKEYVYGAVCAEMPASFHSEALKAQAVACYTYMKWLRENSDNPDTVKSDISDNAEIHQAFITEEELRTRWGNNYGIYSQKVTEAVEAVLGEYLSYENETAMTVFHGLSPGKTVSSADVWESDIPYLQSVTAPGDNLSPEITEEIKIKKDEFIKSFNRAKAEDSDSIIKSAEINSDGFITAMSYKNTSLSSTDIRSALKLRSPHFKAELTEDEIKLTVYGKGHGVGMSQYSADYMARQGSDYKEILSHFYNGTTLISE